MCDRSSDPSQHDTRPAFRGQGIFDPWKCFYASLDGCNICGYCRGDIPDAGPEIGMGSIFKEDRRPCGHWNNPAIPCACVKYRREPITPEFAFQLLARSM